MAHAFETTRSAASVLERLGDDDGVVWAERLIGNFYWWTGKTTDAERVWSRALERAGLTMPRLVIDIHTWIAWSLWQGPVPADEGIRRCDEMLIRLPGNPLLEGNVLVMRASLKAMRGLFDEAHAEVVAGRALLKDIGHYHWWAGTSMVAADIEFTAGEPAAAATVLQEGYELMRQHAETGYLATLVGMRAQAALELEQDDEALRFADEAEELASPDDFEPHVRQRCVRAVVLARRGDFAAAADVLHQAEQIAAPTDYLPLRGLLAMKRADVASLAGDAAEEPRALAQALALAEQKGDLVMAERARARLAKVA
jgi:ATP/maltotriose-dependent transcriptional regulator MalT